MANRLRAGLMVSAAASLLLARGIDGHSVLMAPISRQYSWTKDISNVTGNFTENAPDTYSAGGGLGKKGRSKLYFSDELLELTGGGNRFPLYFFEHLENGNYNETNEVAQRKGVCGDPRQGGQNSQEVFPYSTPNSEWPVLGTYESGAEIEMILSFGAGHWGHFEFFLCDIQDLDDPDGVVTQECLNKYPLNRVAKPNDSPVDPNYPGRYYADPPCRADTGEVEQTTYGNPESRFSGERNGRVTYRLPDIECEHCVLQKVWHTGHTCYHVGYPEFNPPSWNSECAPNKEDWVNLNERHLRRGPCGVSTAYPQEFWSCADIAIVSSGSTPPTTPAPAPAAGTTTMGDDYEEEVEPATGTTTMSDDYEEEAEPTTGATTMGDDYEEEVEPTTGTSTMSDDYEEEAEPTTGTTTMGDDYEEETEPTTGTTTMGDDYEEEAEPTTGVTTMGDDYEEEVEPTTGTTTMGDDYEEEAEPTTGTTMSDDDEYPKALGCFHDSRDDRVLTVVYEDEEMMTTEMCLELCTQDGALFAGTQYGVECWCSEDVEIEYDRHGDDAVCNMPCAGNMDEMNEEYCGGFDAFELYQLEEIRPASAECGGLEILPYEQCGGVGYDGPTCCTANHVCTTMGSCYAQCRPL